MIGEEKLTEFLIQSGYAIYPNHFVSKDNQIKWLACKRGAELRNCETNEHKIGFTVRPFYLEKSHPEYGQISASSFEIDITGEYQGMWFKLQQYSNNLEDIAVILPKAEVMLAKAWNYL